MIRKEFVSSESPARSRAGAGGYPCQGLYWTPEGVRPTVAFIATHYDIDFSEHYLAPLLAERGYGFLGWNTQFRGAGQYFMLEHALVDIGVGVRWLREQAGVETVVVLGNSGGGSLMAAYQSQAVTPHLEARWGVRQPPTLDELVPADLYVSLNAHPGRPEVFTAWLDPSVTDECDPLAVDPTLDLFDVRNGPPYDDDFLHRYRDAQVARNERITDWVLTALERGTASGAVDSLFVVHRVWADPRCEDLTIEPSDRKRGCYLGDTRRANYGPFGVGRVSTLRTWLSMWSLRTSPCRAEQHYPRVEVPSLVVQSMADQGVFPSDAHAIHDQLAAPDKTLAFVPGDHYLLDIASARDDVSDRLVSWVAERT